MTSEAPSAKRFARAAGSAAVTAAPVGISSAVGHAFAIAAAVAGAVFVLMGVQGSGDRQPDALEQEYYSAQGGQGGALPDPAADYDWDDNFKREFGEDGR